jgi:hypothetical protein
MKGKVRDKRYEGYKCVVKKMQVEWYVDSKAGRMRANLGVGLR